MAEGKSKLGDMLDMTKNNGTLHDDIEKIDNAEKAEQADNNLSATQEKSLEQQWHHVRSRLRGELGEATFNSWFRNLKVGESRGRKVVLEVPTRFVCSWIEQHYLTRIENYWRNENPEISAVTIIVGELQKPSAPEARVQEVTPLRLRGDAKHVANGKANRGVPDGAGAAPDDIGGQLDARYTFDNFIVGKSNELAHAAARRISESDGADFNPLFLYGGVGLGKTHLMHAIAWEIRRRNRDRRVLYISAEKFMYQFVRALRFRDTMAFKQQFREVDVLMVDDIQFIAGKESTQEEFFHTFNALIDKNHQVIISADRSPSDLEGIEDRIRSRLGWGLVADIHPTDYELRLGILQSKAEAQLRNKKDIVIPTEVLEFLAQRVSSNIRILEGALNRVVASASLNGKTITLDMTKDVLRDLLRASDRRITIDEIQRKVAEYYNLRMGDMLSARRSRTIARPRQIAMYISKQLTTRSLPEIGRRFGGRDHTTVMHAVKKVEELRENDPSIDEDVDLLLRSLGG